jgi:recombination protein RecT
MTSTDVVRQQVQEAAVAGGGDGQTVFDLIKREEPRIMAALPEHLRGERFNRIAINLVRKTPRLLECDPMTFVGALMVSAQLGLEPGPPLGLSWIIPRRNRKAGGRWEAHFQFGYKGVIELFRRSGQFKSIAARAVKENDEFSYSYGVGPGDDDEHLVHRPLLKGNRGESYAWYAIAKFKNGGHAFVVLGRDEVEKRRARGEDGPAWRTDYDAMASKSCVMALAPWLPLSPELELQLAADGRRFVDIKADMIADIPALEAGSEDDDTEDPRGAGSEPSTHGSGAEAEGDSASASAPRETPVEDATGDQPELLGDEPEWGSEKDWSAEQWKAHARRHGVLLGPLLRHAEEERQESDPDGAPVSAFGHLKGREALCRLVRGWVEEQGA